jgi:hypothetical protein
MKRTVRQPGLDLSSEVEAAEYAPRPSWNRISHEEGLVFFARSQALVVSFVGSCEETSLLAG